jgi:AcrR family transcriptional regulator
VVAVAVEHGRSLRAEQILEEAAALLETEGPEGLTMRRLAARIGIRAPSLYKHFESKEEIEDALVLRGLDDLRAALARARRAREPAGSLVAEVAGFARRHPHLFGLLAERQLVPRLGVDAREQALLVLAQGTCELELAGTMAAGEIGRIWSEGLEVFSLHASPAPARRAVVSSMRGPD